MVDSNLGAYSLFFWDGWIQVVRIFLMLIISYGGFILVLKSSSKPITDLNAAQGIILIAMGSLLGFTLLNLVIPILNFLLAYFLLVAAFHLSGRN